MGGKKQREFVLVNCKNAQCAVIFSPVFGKSSLGMFPRRDFCSFYSFELSKILIMRKNLWNILNKRTKVNRSANNFGNILFNARLDSTKKENSN